MAITVPKYYESFNIDLGFAYKNNTTSKIIFFFSKNEMMPMCVPVGKSMAFGMTKVFWLIFLSHCNFLYHKGNRLDAIGFYFSSILNSRYP